MSVIEIPGPAAVSVGHHIFNINNKPFQHVVALDVKTNEIEVHWKLLLINSL